jgi:hypothetical protein
MKAAFSMPFVVCRVGLFQFDIGCVGLSSGHEPRWIIWLERNPHEVSLDTVGDFRSNDTHSPFHVPKRINNQSVAHLGKQRNFQFWSARVL